MPNLLYFVIAVLLVFLAAHIYRKRGIFWIRVSPPWCMDYIVPPPDCICFTSICLRPTVSITRTRRLIVSIKDPVLLSLKRQGVYLYLSVYNVNERNLSSAQRLAAGTSFALTTATTMTVSNIAVTDEEVDAEYKAYQFKMGYVQNAPATDAQKDELKQVATAALYAAVHVQARRRLEELLAGRIAIGQRLEANDDQVAARPPTIEVGMKQLFNIDDQGITQFKEDILDHLCAQIGDKKVAIISTAGKFRQGKTFWNNVLLRGLQTGGKPSFKPDEYIGGTNGVRFMGGLVRDTQGIMVWPEVFFRKTQSGEEIAVLLIDTQGTFDTRSNISDSAVIFAISLLMSSLKIFNTRRQIDAQDLDALNVFISYSQRIDERVGQQFLIMVRDALESGHDKGQEYLEMLKVQTRNAQKLHELLTGVIEAFETTDCWMIPTPSDLVQRASHAILAGDCGTEFLEELCKCADHLLNNLEPKTVLGTPLTGDTLRQHVENLVTHVKDGHHKAIGSAFSATSQLYFEKARSAGNDYFETEHAKLTAERKHRPIRPAEYEAELQKMCAGAEEAYKACPLFGSPETKTKHSEEFLRALEERCKAKVESNRERYLDGTLAEAVSSGQESYEREMRPTIEDRLGGGPKSTLVVKKHATAEANALDLFEKQTNEFNDKTAAVSYKRQVLQTWIKIRFEDIQGDNASHDAQLLVAKMFEDLLSHYSAQLRAKEGEVRTADDVDRIINIMQDFLKESYKVHKAKALTEVKALLKKADMAMLSAMVDNYYETISARFKRCEEDFGSNARTNVRFEEMKKKARAHEKQQEKYRQETAAKIAEYEQKQHELQKKLEEEHANHMAQLFEKMAEAAEQREQAAEEASQQRDRRYELELEMAKLRMEHEHELALAARRDQQLKRGAAAGAKEAAGCSEKGTR
ncbi:unnamed protein product, partial [Mesorhabditis spiculigera]